MDSLETKLQALKQSIDEDDSIKPVHKDLKLKLQIVKNINLLMQKLVISKEKIFDTLDRFTPLLIIILILEIQFGKIPAQALI